MSRIAWCKDCNNMHLDGKHTRAVKLHPTTEATTPTRDSAVVIPSTPGPDVAALQAQLASAEESERRALEDVVRYTARVKTLEDRLARIEKLARGEA